MINRIKSLDSVLTIGLILSIAIALLMVLAGQDEIQSFLVGLSVIVITLLVDVIARLKEAEERILAGTALGATLLSDPKLHADISAIVSSYQVAQRSDFDLFRGRSHDALLECKETLDTIGRGYMLVEAGGKYSYGKKGVQQAKTIIKAVAYQDVESWRTKHLEGVLHANAEARGRDIPIQRIFVLSPEQISQAQDVLDRHADAGVEVYVVSPDELPSTQLLESYQIVDDRVLVIFYYTRDGKSFREERISIEPVEVDRAVNRFESTLRRAQRYKPQSVVAEQKEIDG